MKVRSNYKLYDTLRKLTRKEIREIKKLLKSPFFVLRNDVGDLFETLSNYVLKDKPFPAKEQVFKMVFPDKSYSYMLLRGTMSDLFELIQEYFLVNKQRSNVFNQRHLLAQIYREKELPKCYQGVVKKTGELLDKYPRRNEFYYRQLLEFQLEEMQSQFSNKRTKTFNLDTISESMDVVYLAQKLKHTCTQFSHQQIFNKEYDFGLLSHLLAPIENERYLSIPAIAIYYYCYRFLTEPNGDVYFLKFKEILFKDKMNFDQNEIKTLHLHAINFCVRQINRGRAHFSKEILELYQDGLEAGYLLEKGQLSSFSFNNIVAASTKLEEYDWCEKFIEEYAHYLNPEHRHSTVSFNLARLEYSRKNYGEAMLHLQNAAFKDELNTLIAKTMLTRIYYELGETDSLFSHLDSFQVYIRRKEISDFYRTNYLNNIRFVKKLVSLIREKKQIEAFRAEIENEHVLFERPWLLEKLDEM